MESAKRNLLKERVEHRKEKKVLGERIEELKGIIERIEKERSQAVENRRAGDALNKSQEEAAAAATQITKQQAKDVQKLVGKYKRLVREKQVS